MNDYIRAGLQMKVVNDKIRKFGDRAFAQYDLTGPQVGYLNFIKDEGGSVTQKSLERHFSVSHPTIVGVVSRLQKKGFITVKIDESDRRNRILTLTDQAIEVDKSLYHNWKKMTKDMFENFTAEDLNNLNRMLDTLEKNIDECLEKERKIDHE